jgi:outer membrane scaffolding protein for murein synthesis (MipA/OmpV family)
LTIYASTGISYADDILNGYFYSVQSEFVTPDRDQYRAGAGYAGFHLTGAISKDLSERWAIGAYFRWRNINGAVFEDSPLVRTSNNYYASVALVWKFARSKEMVTVSE